MFNSDKLMARYNSLTKPLHYTVVKALMVKLIRLPWYFLLAGIECLNSSCMAPPIMTKSPPSSQKSRGDWPVPFPGCTRNVRAPRENECRGSRNQRLLVVCVRTKTVCTSIIPVHHNTVVCVLRLPVLHHSLGWGSIDSFISAGTCTYRTARSMVALSNASPSTVIPL